MDIIIVDDHKIFREGLKMYLEMQLGHKVIAEASNGREFLDLPNIHKADIVLMDIEMPEMNGLEASKEVLKQYNYLKIIALTMYRDKAYLKDLIERGIRGFIPKTNTFENVHKVLNGVYKNQFCFPNDLKVEAS